MYLAAQAEIIPTVLDHHHGAVLDQGRDRRIATLALPEWLHDDKTEVDNLTLLCG